MKIKNIIVWATCIAFWLIVLGGALTNTYNVATPSGDDDPREADDRMREIKAAVQEFMNNHNGQANEGDHYWPLTGNAITDTAVGQHRQITLRQLSDDPDSFAAYTTTTDLGWLYQKDVSDNGELFWEDEAENVLQLTSAGALYSSGNLSVAGNATITGTLDVISTLDPNSFTTTNGGFKDEDDMSSDSATAVASQQSIKAYVDNNVGSANWTPTSYSADVNESITFPNGLIFKHGYIARSGSDTTITFETAFPNGVVSASYINYRTTDVGILAGLIKTFSTTTIVIYQGENAVTGFYWQAWGY